MDLSAVEHLIYGLIAGLSEILPVSAQAHSALMLKMLGAERIDGLPVLLVHLGVLAAIYVSSREMLVKMSRARRLARIPKKKRKRPLDIRSLMDSRFLITMCIPVFLMLLFYKGIASIRFSLLATAALLFLNGAMLYVPQFFPGCNKDARSLSRIEGLLMGLGGCLSAFPGLSGIGAALSVGSVCGVERSYALNMALIMDMLYLIGRIIYDVLGLISVGLGGLTFSIILTYLLTAAVAFISAMLGIRIMRSLAAEAGYHFFAYYCWGVALIAFILNLMA